MRDTNAVRSVCGRCEEQDTPLFQSLRGILDILPDAMLVVDENFLIVACNELLAQLFGYETQALIGRALNVLIPTQHHAAHDRHLSVLTPGGHGRLMDGRPVLFGRHKDGTNVPVSIAITCVDNGDGRLFLGVVRDVELVARSLKEAINAAMLDALTQIGNRRYLLDFLERLSTEDDSNAVLLLLDLDRFKPINDEYGHPIGDEVLRIMAKRLRGVIRETDACARLGGDEFVVVLSGAQRLSALETVAVKIHRILTQPVHVGGHVLELGASIGCACGQLSEMTPEQLLKRADHAMYSAKRSGRAYAIDGEVVVPPVRTFTPSSISSQGRR
ncbi:MAG: sensor domain-containing diguanylate cyclase [Dehalococcoidia bacterium]